MTGLPLTGYPNERIIRIIKMVELKQNGRCISCKELITKDHAAVSSGRPRHYYHKLRHQTTSYDAASKSIKTVSLNADMQTMKEIILDLGLEMG